MSTKAKKSYFKIPGRNTEDMAKMVVCALVGSRFDYANSILFGATRKNISKLQKAQNLLARVVTCSPQSCSPYVVSSSSSTGSPLNTALTSKYFPYSSFFPTSLPTIILACLSTHSTRCLRLSNTNLLSVPFVRISFGARSFRSQHLKSGTLSFHLSVAVPVLMPFVVTTKPTTASRPFNPLNPSPLAPQIRLLLTIVRVYKLYLLTYLLTTVTRPPQPRLPKPNLHIWSRPHSIAMTSP